MAKVHHTLVFDPAGARLAGERHDGAGPTISSVSFSNLDDLLLVLDELDEGMV
jgi:hypothetical protein